MVVRVFKNDEGLQEMKKILETLQSEDIASDIINGWFADKAPLCYFLYDGNVLKSLAFVTKCDFDPLEKHSNPHVLNYIYTLKEFRNEGYAMDLVNFIKNQIDFSAFCGIDNADAVALLTKAGCRNHGEYNNAILLRCP